MAVWSAIVPTGYVDGVCEPSARQLDDSQLKLLKRNMESARRQLKEDLFRAYRHLYLLDKNNAVRHIDLGQITSSATTPSDGIVGLYLRELPAATRLPRA